MKKIILIVSFLMLVSLGVFSQTISFKTLEVNYGSILKGSDGVREFSFTNTGTAPLIIENAQPSCGCTVPSYPKEPIMPGQSDVIKIKYDTNKVGAFLKYVTLTTNDPANNQVRISLKGEVKQAESENSNNNF